MSGVNTPAAPDAVCNDDIVSFKFQQLLNSPPSNSLSVSLDVGAYTITKKLTVNNDALQTYLNIYLGNCAQTLSNFETTEAQNLDISGCSNTCGQCVAALGGLGNYIIANQSTTNPPQPEIDRLTNEYNNLVEDCMEPCRYVSECDANKEALLSDMSPDGQYADYEGLNNTFAPEQYPLSVFNPDNSLSKKTQAGNPPSWKEPEHYQLSSNPYHYYDDDNLTVSTVDVVQLSAGIFQPPVANNAFLIPPYNSNPGLTNYSVEPQNLASCADFVQAWKPSWARSLIKYHPEYCYLEWCLTNRTTSLSTPVGPLYNYNIDPNTGNPTTLNTNNPHTLFTSNDYDSLLVAVDDLDYIGSGSSGAGFVLDPLQYDPYWQTTGFYYVAPSGSPAFPNANPSQALPRPASLIAPALIGTAPNVSQLQGSPTSASPADFSATSLHYPDKLDYKTANDRFWNFKGSGLSLYQYAAIASSSLAAQMGQSSGGLVNLLNASSMYANTPSASSPITYITNLKNTSPAEKDQKRKTWEFFKTIYLTMKQELQQEAAESYVMNGPCRGCNDCIGQKDFDQRSVPFTTYANYEALSFFPVNPNNNFANYVNALFTYYQSWFLPYFTNNLKQQCGVSTVELYKGKAKRFQQSRDVKSLDESADGTTNLAANIFATTGMCPNAYYFLSFLNNMADPSVPNNFKSSPAISLNQLVPAFNSVLYAALVSTNTPPSSPTPSYILLSTTGNQLFGKINEAGSFPAVSQVKFKLEFTSTTASPAPSPNILDWANYNGSYRIVNFFDLQITSQYGFNIKARVQTTGSGPVQTYEVALICATYFGPSFTPIDFVSCSFDMPCKLNSNARALNALFNSLASTGQFVNSAAVEIGGATSPTLGSPHNAVFTNQLKPFLETALPNNLFWFWEQVNPSQFRIYDFNGTGPSGNNNLAISILSSTPAMSPSDLACVNNFKSFRLDPNNPGEFFADAHIDVVPGLLSACAPGVFTVHGKVEVGPNLSSGLSPFILGDCNFDLLSCRGPEYDVKKDMEAFVTNVANFGNLLNSNSKNLTNNSLFTGLLRSYAGNGTNAVPAGNGNPPLISVPLKYYYWLKDLAVSNSTLVSGWIFESTLASVPSSPPTNACSFSFRFLNPTGNVASSPGSFTSLSNFTLNADPLKNGGLYSFKVKNNSNDILVGETSCLPMKNCESCTTTTTIQPVSTNSAITIQPFNSTVPFTLVYNSSVTANAPYVAQTFNTSGPIKALESMETTLGGIGYHIVSQGSINANCQIPGYYNQGAGQTTPGFFFCNQEPHGASWTPSQQISSYCLAQNTTTYTQNFNVAVSNSYFLSLNVWGALHSNSPLPNLDYIVKVYVDNTLAYTNHYFFNPLSQPAVPFNTPPLSLTSGVHQLKIEILPQHEFVIGFYMSPIKINCSVQGNPSYLPCANTTSKWPSDTLPTVDYEEPCAPYLQDNIDNAASVKYEQYIEKLKNAFVSNYKRHCLGQARENLFMKFNDNDYHFTLYYYDQAGNLVRTVPPEGVKLLNPANTGSPAIYQDLKTQRANYPSGQAIFTSHEFKTTYTYNSLNQLVKQSTPDAGTSYFFYDNLGRLVMSQNAAQAARSNAGPYYCSYTRFDDLGRIVEAGEIKLNQSPGSYGGGLPAMLSASNFPVNFSPLGRSEVTNTYYSSQSYFAYLGWLNFGQANIRNRISTVTTEEVYDGNDYSFDNASHYSYDIHGNVKELLQENRALNVAPFVNHQFKRMKYRYGLISGKVNEVSYQDGERDMLAQRYQYDALNRLTGVFTSRNGYAWDQDAKYYYYLHGPLARLELGHHKVQGQDFAYTLQGWIKGVNSNVLLAANDIGKDGFNLLGAFTGSNYVNNYSARDAYGYSLNYFATNTADDYKPVNSALYASQSSYFLSKLPALNNPYPQLYNGNISSMGTGFLNADPALTSLPNTGVGISKYGNFSQLRLFTYDQLNRIINAAAPSNYINATNTWQPVSSNPTQYNESFSYDQNGNIITAGRNSASSTIDNLQYYYYTQSGGTFLPGSGSPVGPTNKLARVADAVGASIGNDIGNQSNANNYTYDENGNLISDASEQIASIEWTVYGKIRRIIRSASSTKKNLEFKYDAQGNRISKRVYTGTSNQTDYQTTYYVRDAQGNVMATYEKDYQTSAPAITLKLKELDLYGSSRLGNISANSLLVQSTGNGPVVLTNCVATRVLGTKNYELGNHLGNVLAVVSDRKIAIDNNNDGQYDYFVPDILSTTDYYAFGMAMPGRMFNNGMYGYGFNGKENDDEIKGIGNSVNFDARIYDSRVGRWFSVDPLANKFPGFSPYNYALNNPLFYVDPDGGSPTPAALKNAAKILGVPVAAIAAVYKVETGGHAFRSNGDPVILFERHYFSRYTKGKYDETHAHISNPNRGGYGLYSDQVKKLAEAAALDKEAAYKSVSFGGFQIMGDNYAAAGFASVFAFAETMMSKDEDKHLEAFVNFVKNNTELHKALKALNWKRFASGYNGPQYSENKYDIKMKAAYEDLQAAEDLKRAAYLELIKEFDRALEEPDCSVQDHKNENK